MHLSGKFITFEGIEGVGKTTNIKFIAEWLSTAGIEVVLTREPGGTEIAEDIRKVLLAKHIEPMCSQTELLLLFAARAQHINQVIVPALQRDACVLCDRFTDASYAYQGGGRGIEISKIANLEKWVQGNFRPDLTIIFDMDPELALQRVQQRNKKIGHHANDRIEQEHLDFFIKVRAMYLQLAKMDPVRYRIIAADRALNVIQAELQNLLSCEYAI